MLLSNISTCPGDQESFFSEGLADLEGSVLDTIWKHGHTLHGYEILGYSIMYTYKIVLIHSFLNDLYRISELWQICREWVRQRVWFTDLFKNFIQKVEIIKIVPHTNK